MRLDTPNTLSYFLDLPHRKTYAIGWLPAPGFGKAVKHTRPTSNTQYANPDYDAVEFYALNQLVSLLEKKYAPDEPLPEWAQTIAEAYAKVVARQAITACHYLILICTRESRHLNSAGAFWSTKKDVPKEFKAYHALYAKTDPEKAQDMFMHHAPEITMSEYTNALCVSFLGNYGGGFGGKKWHNVAMCLHRFITGESSAEMMVDTVYTLAHNGGPIFNKGMYYHHYSDDLIKILDIQRSGQVAEAVYEGTVVQAISQNNHQAKVSALKNLVVLAKKHMPEIGNYVDWFKVEELGAKHKYAFQKSNQQKMYGLPSELQDKAKAKKILLINGQPAKFTGKFEVLPDQYVDVFERVHA